MKPADYVLSFIGLCMGTAAALFPWHVYMHPDAYGPPRMTFSRGGVIPEAEILALQSGDPLYDMETGKFVLNDRPRPALDPMTTGKVDRKSFARTDLAQPYPGNGAKFEVLSVNASRALVGDSAGVYLVRPLSRLPDGTVALAFEKDDAGWYIRTSAEKMLRAR